MERLLFDFKGLVTAPGRLARAEASCIDTKNVVFDTPGAARKRRGWRRLLGNTAGLPWKAFSSSAWGANCLLSRGLNSGSVSLAFGDGGLFASISLPDGGSVVGTPSQRVMGAQSLRSFYLAAQAAPVRCEPDMAVSDKAKYAGMPRGLPISISTGAGLALAGSLLPDGYARAYRVTWHRFDGDGVLLSGPPTARWVVRNQSGTTNWAAGTPKDTVIAVRIPAEWGTDSTSLTTEYFWRLWGTRTFNSVGNEEGDDEMYLLSEAQLSGAEIVAGVTAGFTDSTPDDFLTRQLALNTNSINFESGDIGVVNGLANADEPPPVAYEVASWANVTWWADVRYRPSSILYFLSTGSPSGLQDNDTITVQIGTTPLTLRAKTVPTLATDFKLYSAVYATVQQNLEATALAFADILNRQASLGPIGIRAYTVGLPTSLSAVVYLEASRIDTSGIGLQMVSSRATWYRLDNALSGRGIYAGNGAGGEARNALCYSKPQRADAVPYVNRINVGPNNARILRVQPYRDRMFVFTDQGIYVVTGRNFASFAIAPLALELTLLAREAVCVCDDAVYAWCTQGIVRISGAGWEIVSTPIEPTLQDIVKFAVDGALSPLVPSLAFAVADTAQHRVLFWYPEPEITPSGVHGCAFALCFDTRTSAWSQYRVDGKNTDNQLDMRAHGCVRFSDKRVLLTSQRNLNDSEGYLYEERLDYAATDFTDDYSSGTSGAILSSLTLAYQIPDVGGAQHWLQTVLQFDAGEFSWRSLPTSVSLIWKTETLLTNSITVTPSKRVMRVEPGRNARRSNSITVQVLHQSSEYFGLVGVQQRYEPGSIFAGGKAR